MAFQRRSWKVQHGGWACMAVAIVLAAAGVFSDGPVSDATAKDSAGRMTVEYERFMRQDAQSRIRIEIDPSVAAAGATVRIAGALAEDTVIRSIHPRPVSDGAANGALLLRMAPTAPGTAATIHIAYEAHAVGRRRSEIGLEGQPPTSLFQFVFP